MVTGNWIVLAFLGVIAVQEGYSLRCYSCSSKEDKNCIDPARHRISSTECNVTALAQVKELADRSVSSKLAQVYYLELKPNTVDVPYECVKQITKETVSGAEEEVVLRGCQIATVGKPTLCEKIEAVGTDTVTHCSVCNTDECNSAPYEAGSRWLTMLATTLLLLLSKYFLAPK